MATTDAILRGAVSGRGRDFRLTLDPAFQGLPETAHGGSVLAACDAVGAIAGPRIVAGRYRRRVPLARPLALRVSRDDRGVTYRVCDADGALLVDGSVAPGVGHADSANAMPLAPPRDGFALPISRTCFACGVENPLGLRVRLAADAHAVGATWAPRAELAGADGTLATVALTTLLDETAFWLGALATGESGMTTELSVALHRVATARGPVTVGGGRAAVRPRAEDGRYWDTRVEARDASGALVASAAITFVAVRGAARRLATGLLAINPPELLRRVFPAYVP
jgi:acyl-coenzyme A thioesterase PaaI-like protein